MRTRTSADRRRTRLISLNARIAACRACHLRGYLDELESVPIVREPEPDAAMPRILLIGQAPGLKATVQGRPFAGRSGEKLRDWFEAGGIPRADFWRKIHFAAVTRCYPGRVPGARGDRVPSPEEQALCRPWQDDLFHLLRPEVVLLVGLLAIRTYLGPVPAEIRDGVRYLPLPHPSGVSRWLNDPANVAAVGRASAILKGWVGELGL